MLEDPKTRRRVLGAFSYGTLAAINAPARAALVAPGAAPSPAPFFQFGAPADVGPAPAWLPFLAPEAGHIIVEGTVNGVRAHIMVDSGVGTFVLDRAFSEKLRLSGHAPMAAVGVNGTATGQAVAGVDIALGNIRLSTAGAGIFDLSAAAAAIRIPIDAILGRDAFNYFKVDIDFRNARIAFLPAWSSAPVPGGVALHLEHCDFGLRSFAAEIEGQPVRALFDLGSDQALIVAPAYAAAAGLLEDRKVSTSVNLGIEGAAVSQVAVVRSLAFAGARLTDVPSEVPAAWSYSVQAIAGLPIFRKFRTLVDFPNNRVVLAADSGAIADPFPKDRAGFGATRVGDHLKIVHIACNSPAEHAGLHVGDIITAINGHPLDAAYFKTYTRHGTRSAGTRFVLGLANGARIELTLADYF